MKNNIFILLLFLLFSCSNSTKENYGNGLFQSFPVNKENFLNPNYKFVTIEELNAEKINNRLNCNYYSYKKYISALDRLSFRSYHDYMITGTDINGEEHLIYFYTSHRDEGTQIWGEFFVENKLENIKELLNISVAKKINNRKIIIKKKNYNLRLICDESDVIHVVSIINSNKKLTIDEFEVLDEFFYRLKEI